MSRGCFRRSKRGQVAGLVFSWFLGFLIYFDGLVLQSMTTCTCRSMGRCTLSQACRVWPLLFEVSVGFPFQSSSRFGLFLWVWQMPMFLALPITSHLSKGHSAISTPPGLENAPVCGLARQCSVLILIRMRNHVYGSP